MNYTGVRIREFIDYIITIDSVDEILDNCSNQAERGFIFERLFDIVIKFGFCDLFKKSDYFHFIGNSNNGKPKLLVNLDYYLRKKVISSKSGGCSDITLQNKNDKSYIFISSKYPKTEEDYDKQKNVEYYDIQNIIAMAAEKKNKHIYKNYKIYLVVPEKKSVFKKFKNASETSKYITKHIKKENILDKDDLNNYFLKFKESIIENKDKDWQSIYLKVKKILRLRFHQELFTQKTSDLISEGNKTFLWGCKCRSGKTFMIGGIIAKQLKVKNKLNVLIITPAPTETMPQFTDDLFVKFVDFNSFKIHHIEGSKMLDKIEIGENNIFIMSKQLLQKYTFKNTITKIKNLNLDIIGFDESHFSGCTDLSKDIIKSYSTKNTVKIFLTATYNKPLREWNILHECQMYWDIEDEQICKSILTDEKNISRLKEKHGSEYVDKTINYYETLGYSINKMFECYTKMPDLYLITSLFDQQRYEILKERLNNENKFGFCFDTLFSLNKNKNRFCFKDDVRIYLRYISGSYKEEVRDNTIYPRIARICSTKETRTPFTQIWFLPSDNINEISQCLKYLMKEDVILRRYIILCVNRKNKNMAKDIKDEIVKHEKVARSQGKLGLIILAGNMLTLGITLKLCDLVILMNNSLSSDKVLQQMYRSMTEGKNKKIGFVVDLNISRVLNTCVNYTVYKHEQNIDDKIKYIINNRLMNIDIDIMEIKKINSDVIIKKLMDIWKSDPINSFRNLLRKLDNDYEEFDSTTQKLLNKTFSKTVKNDYVNIKLRIKDEDDDIQELPTGKIINIDEDDDKYEEEENVENEVEEVIDGEEEISFTKDVLPYVIPLTCILTIKNNNMDFVKMLNDIKENPELLETFDDQCLLWWNKKDLIELIKNIINKYFDKDSNTYKVSIQFKMSLQSLIDNPKELLCLINDCLKPKEIEKKKNGEVFTPMNLINEMLDKLPIEVWNNKNLKWLDPASGMGNFPIAVYLRLMKSLITIENIKDRKKHILENMLYMSEINKKNVLVCKQIFDINNEYKLNIYEGDSLAIDYYKEFNVKRFDIIIGNPPYNKGGIRSCTGKLLGEKNETIWTKFVELSFRLLKPNGYLVFINPLSWLKKSHSLHNLLLEKHILWLKLWDTMKSKEKINGAIPISLYVLKNKLNINKRKTKIDSEIKGSKLNLTSIEYLNKDYSIPLAYHSIFNKLIEFINKNNCRLEYNTKTVKSIGTKTKIPLKYKLKDMLAIDTYTIKEGILVKKAIEIHKDADKKKLIIANKRSFNGAFIDDGRLSLTGNDKYYIIGDKLKLLLKLFSFKFSKTINYFTKYRQDFLNNDAFTYIPDIRKLGIKDINEKEFYKLIGLTSDEIKILYK